MMAMNAGADRAQSHQDQAQHLAQALGALELAHAFLGAAIQTLRWTPQDKTTVVHAFRVFEQRMSEARESIQKFNTAADPTSEVGGSLPN